PNREPRVAAGYVENEVVAGVLTGEVLTLVVEDAIGAERSRLLEVPRAADRGHMRAERLRDLDGERSDATRSAVDQHPLACLEPSVVPQPLQGGQAGDRHRGRLLERGVGWLPDEVRRAHVLGECPVLTAEDLVAGLKVGDILADGLHDSREVDPEQRILRAHGSAARNEPEDPRPAAQRVPVELVERGRADADEHSFGAQRGPFDLLYPNHPA